MNHDEWPVDEATEPEGAHFLASSPYALLSSNAETDASSVWDLGAPPSACRSGQRTAVFTSSRATCLEATQVSAIADPSLFEDVTEPVALRSSPTDPERTVVSD